MKRFAVVAVLALLVGGADQAKADILFNNFGPGDTYDTSTGYIIGRFEGTTVTFVQGDAFVVTGGNFTLNSLTLALSWVSGPNAVDVQLRANAGGLPGTVLETFHFDNLGTFGNPNPPVIATSTLHPLLLDGEQYWITASASDLTDIAWNLNSIKDVGPHAISQNGEPFTVATDDRGAFRVDASSNAVPEPASLTMLGLGALGFAGYAWRRRKKAAA